MKRAVIEPQLTMVVDDQLDFKAKGGVLIDDKVAAVKWYGFAAGNPRQGLPNFIPLIILNALPTGKPLSVLNGHWISGMRTAAISAVAARTLADPRSDSVGFIGAGLQALSHLDALRADFPLRRILVHSRTRETAAGLLARASTYGIDAMWSADSELAVRDQPIVVSCIPRMTERAAYLDAGWLARGAFAAMVDAGTAWIPESLGAIDRAYTDHLDPITNRPLETLFYSGAFAGQLSDIAGRRAAELGLTSGERRAMIFGGSGLADTAVAALAYRRACERGLGTRLAM